MLISRGNKKLGTLPNFSLPIITTCPGKTLFCDRFCYGKKGWFASRFVKDINERRLDATLKNDFADIIVKEIRRTMSPVFRFHVIGDFYSVEYVEKWIDITKRLSEVVFFGSTRSWRCDFLAESIKRLRDLTNVYLKASVDVTDALDPFSCGWKVWSVEGEGARCPHDYGLVPSCDQCRRCWTVKDCSISFKLRWGRKSDYLAAGVLN